MTRLHPNGPKPWRFANASFADLSAERVEAVNLRTR